MYQKNYTNYYYKMRGGNAPQSAGNFGIGTKKAVKHFTDLEVYQKALESSVFVAKLALDFQEKENKLKKKNNNDSGVREYTIKNMAALALSIPHLIAEAHSTRFGSGEQCLFTLDKVMLGCNKMVVYLEQARDICETGLELEQFEEQIKKYFFIRQKVLNLQRVWRKYIEINKQEQKEK
ncbi:MAG: hypothetical protein V1804_02380 [Patescibacteria group bacterium]